MKTTTESRPVGFEHGVEGFAAEVDGFLARVKMSPSRLGREVMDNDRQVARIRKGQAITLSTAVRMRAWMNGYEAGLEDAKGKKTKS